MSLKHINASNGSGEAVLAKVTALRTAGSTVLIPDFTTNFPTNFIATTGKQLTSGAIDPATVLVFFGHLSASQIIIDSLAPGYTDTGSSVGNIIVIKPTTAWADNFAALLAVEHNDDGTLKNTSLDDFYKPGEVSPTPFVVSGGNIAVTSGLTGSFTDIVGYYLGLRFTKTAVANNIYTASRDTYVDIDPVTGTVYYTAVANNATTGFALVAGRVRLALVVTNGSTITSVRQSGYDALGNRIYNTSPVNPTQPAIWWEELGRTTLTAIGGDITVNIPARKYLQVLFYLQGSGGGTITAALRFNNDTGSNYAFANMDNGAAASGVANQSSISLSQALALQENGEVFVTNLTGFEKVVNGGSVVTTATGAGSSPGIRDFMGKWANTSAPITSVSIVQLFGGTGQYAIGSEVVVLGHN